jgi:hypothetical protein
VKTFDSVVAWLIFGVGIVHCFATAVLFKGLRMPAVWFFGSGLALLYVAALNLLRIRYDTVASGVRAVCVVGNSVMMVFVIIVGATMSLRRNPQAVLFIALIVAATALSILRRPQAPARA